MSLMALALAAAVAGPDPLDPNEPDLLCVGVFSIAVNAADEESRTKIAGGVLYFLGKIDGRSPGYDFEGNLRQLFGGRIR